MPWKNVCPQCGKRFRKLDRLKDHMTSSHGGFTASEIAASGVDPENQDAARVDAPTAVEGHFELTPDSPEVRSPSEPRRSTRHNRELNVKINSAIDTIVEKALGMPVSNERMEELKQTRADIRNAAFGLEFDFDEKVTKKVSSKWILVLLIVALYVLPYMPPIPIQKLVAELKAGSGKKKAVASNEPNKNNGSDRAEGQRQDVSSVADVREN